MNPPSRLGTALAAIRPGPLRAAPVQLDLEGWRGRALVLVLGLAVGLLVALAPTGGILVVGGSVSLMTLLLLGRRIVTVFQLALAALLAGYAFLGRGLAHVGVPPLYVSEMVLVLALIAIVVALPKARFGLVHGALFLFMGWGLVRTVPYVGTYGLDAFRDAVTWAYGLFALAVSITIRPSHFVTLARWYRRAIPFFLVWVPIAAILSIRFGNYLPTPPGSDVPIVFFKGGDMGVHLAGVGAFILVGLFGLLATANAWVESMTWAGWLLAVAVAGAVNRGGMLSASMAITSGLFIRSSVRWFSLGFVALLLVVSAGLLNPTVDVGASRTVSVAQLTSNVLSVLNDTGNTGLEGTKTFRLQWWSKIVDYTIGGAYFWTGKGYGINLADADGFQIEANHALRAPHNSHLEILARSGVPGLVSWLLLQLVFAAVVLRAAFRARARGDLFWTRILGWIFVYWLAALVDTSFDPYLEGPQGGVWFWTVVGLGIAAARFAWSGEQAGEPAAPPSEPNGMRLPPRPATSPAD